MESGKRILIIGIVYLIGYILTLIFLSRYGKQLIGDFDEPKTYADYDDYESNNQAWTIFSALWPVYWVIFSISCVVTLISKISKKIIKLSVKK